MDPNRRDILAMLTALAAAGPLGCKGDEDDSAEPGPDPAPDRPPEPEPWQAPGTLDDTAFAWSLVVSDVTADGALVALHTTEEAVDFVLVGEIDGGWEELDRQTGLEPVDAVVQLELTGLESDRAHHCVFLSADGARRSDVTRFRTALDGTGFRKLVIGATSCLGSANPSYDNLARLAERKPDLVLLLGDTVYADGSFSTDAYRSRWRRVLAKPSFRTMAASSSLAATWDDHEVDNNWVLGETVSQPQLENAVAAFHEAVPWRQGDKPIGLWRSLKWGDVLEVFLLDSRGERDWDTRIVSDEQLAWATDGIRNSTATFKIVCCSVHLTDHSELFGIIEDQDRWQGYPLQRDALVAACEAVPGVIVLTGDMHFGSLQKLAPAGEPGDSVYEVAAGPGGSNVLPASEISQLGGDDISGQYPILIDTWTASVLTFDPGLGTVLVEFIDDEGTVVASETLTIA